MRKHSESPKKLRAYMAFSQATGPSEFACLVFAKTAKEARKLAYDKTCWWDEWIDVGVKWLKDSPHIFHEADKLKTEKGIAHVIECPTVCKCCTLWGQPFNDDGICVDCAELL